MLPALRSRRRGTRPAVTLPSFSPAASRSSPYSMLVRSFPPVSTSMLMSLRSVGTGSLPSSGISRSTIRTLPPPGHRPAAVAQDLDRPRVVPVVQYVREHVAVGAGRELARRSPRRSTWQRSPTSIASSTASARAATAREPRTALRAGGACVAGSRPATFRFRRRRRPRCACLRSRSPARRWARMPRFARTSRRRMRGRAPAVLARNSNTPQFRTRFESGPSRS